LSDDPRLKVAVFEEEDEIKSRIQHEVLSITDCQKAIAELECMKRVFMDILDDLQQPLDNRESEKGE
jgi:butyrate kinase